MSRETTDYQGGCLCGHVRYRALGEPLGVTHCHCSMCRRSCGAAFVTWVSFPKADFSLTSGELSRFKSSERVERSFCNRCGTAIAFAETSRPDEIDLTVGSFDEPERLSPEDHIWTDARLRWLRVDDGLPEYSQDLPSQ